MLFKCYFDRNSNYGSYLIAIATLGICLKVKNAFVFRQSIAMKPILITIEYSCSVLNISIPHFILLPFYSIENTPPAWIISSLVVQSLYIATIPCGHGSEAMSYNDMFPRDACFLHTYPSGYVFPIHTYVYHW